MMMTGRPGWRALTCVQQVEARARPACGCRDTSTCGVVVVERRHHVARVARSCAPASFSRASAFSSTQRIDWSSSTIQIGFMVSASLRLSLRRDRVRRRVRQGSGISDPEIRAARPALAFDHAQVLLHEGLRQRQPEPAAALAPGHQRDRRCGRGWLRDARSVVDDMQVQCQPVAILAQRDLARDPGAQHELASPAAIRSASACAALCAMLSTRLDQLLLVAAEFGHGGVVVALDRQAAAGTRPGSGCAPARRLRGC